MWHIARARFARADGARPRRRQPDKTASFSETGFREPPPDGLGVMPHHAQPPLAWVSRRHLHATGGIIAVYARSEADLQVKS